MIRRLTIAGSTAALLFVHGALAAEAAAPAGNLDEIVIVATRAPVRLDRVGNSVTVLGEQAIAASQATMVSDLLASTPGVSYSRNGGPGTPTALRIRGAEADQTLVLIDGVQVNDPAAPGGGFDFGNLLAGDVARIEILRGAQSALYGSQAIGGIVNITTREAAGKLAGSVQAETGELQSGLLKAGVGGQFQRLSFRLAGAHYSTDSVSTFAGGRERDPYRNTTYAARLGFAFTPRAQLDLRAHYTDALYHYDGFPAPSFAFADEGDFGTTRQFIGYAGLNFEVLDGKLRNRLAYQATRVSRGTFLDTGTALTRTGDFRGENGRAEYQGTWAISARHLLVFGLQDEQQKMASDSAPRRADVSQQSAYVLLQAELAPGLTLTAGGRHDDHTTYGQHDTAQAAVAWALPTRTLLRASWSQGFKAPTLYQLYSPYFNRALDPETSEGWDAGVEQPLLDGRATVSATYFSRDTRNQIDFTNCSGAIPACAQPGHSSFGVYSNVARARATGIELQAAFRPTPAWQLSANYTSLKAENRTPGASFGKRLLRRPDDTLNASVGYTWRARLGLAVALRQVSASFDNATNTRRLAGYTLVDVRASYPLSESTELYGRVENAGDARYETVYQYGTLGRAAYVGVKARF